MIKQNFRAHILAVSNEAFSGASSNGRTLMNFLRGIAPQQLAQFYLHGVPDTAFCTNYYCVSDRDALDAFLNRKSISTEKVSPKQANSMKKIQRNCRNMVFRNMIWMSFKWWTEDFDAFLDRVNPAVVLFQAGDMPFMFEIAMRIASEREIPLIMYNSEGYVLKDKLYSGASRYSPWHLALQSALRRSYKKIMNAVSYCIYSTEYLEKCYQKRYPHSGRSTALYTGSEMKPLPEIGAYDSFHLLYCGNLGVGRAGALAEVAQILQGVAPDAVLDIYGRFVSQEDQDKLCGCSNVHYGGTVPYDEVPGLMSRASMLLHCEHPDRVGNLQNAFSTKIADSLASGRPFLVYAAEEYPFVQYLKENDSAHIAGTPGELSLVLSRCISDEAYRTKYVEAGVRLARERHNVEKNCKIFLDVLNKILEEKQMDK